MILDLVGTLLCNAKWICVLLLYWVGRLGMSVY